MLEFIEDLRITRCGTVIKIIYHSVAWTVVKSGTLYSYILSDTVLTAIMQKDLWSEIPQRFLNVVLFILML